MAACGLRGSADMSVFLPQDRAQQKKCFLQLSEAIDHVDIGNWTQQLTDDQWEQVRDTLLKEFGVVIDNVLQFQLHNMVEKVVTATESDTFQEQPIDAYAMKTAAPTGAAAAASVGGFQIFVVEYQGKKHTIDVDEMTTVGDLRAIIHRCTGVAPDRFRLIFGGKQLDDDNVILATVNNIKGGTVFMMDRLRGGMPGGGMKRMSDGTLRNIRELTNKEVLTNLKSTIGQRQAGIGTVSVTFTNRFATQQQQIITRADDPKSTNPFGCILETLTPEQVEEINDCMSTHYGSHTDRFKAMGKIVFGDIGDAIAELRNKVTCMEDLMTYTLEYCFTKEFGNAKDENNMDSAKKLIKGINNNMKRAEGAAEERSRQGTEASGSGMQMG